MICQTEEAKCPYCSSIISIKGVTAFVYFACPECDKVIRTSIKVVHTLDLKLEKAQ